MKMEVFENYLLRGGFYLTYARSPAEQPPAVCLPRAAQWRVRRGRGSSEAGPAAAAPSAPAPPSPRCAPPPRAAADSALCNAQVGGWGVHARKHRWCITRRAERRRLYRPRAPLLQTLPCSPLSVLPPLIFLLPRAMPQLLPTSHSWLLSLTRSRWRNACRLWTAGSTSLATCATKGRRPPSTTRRRSARTPLPASSSLLVFAQHVRMVCLCLDTTLVCAGSACNPIGGPDFLLPRAKCTLPLLSQRSQIRSIRIRARPDTDGHHCLCRRSPIIVLPLPVAVYVNVPITVAVSASVSIPLAVPAPVAASVSRPAWISSARRSRWRDAGARITRGRRRVYLGPHDRHGRRGLRDGGGGAHAKRRRLA